MYSGWKLSNQSRNELLGIFPPQHTEVIAHHVTEQFGKQSLPDIVKARIVGYANNPDGVEALVVEINGSTVRPDGKIYHITWSIDRQAGFKPVSSNDLLQNGFTDVEPIDIKVESFYVDGKRREWTIAVERCRDDGYDPFFCWDKRLSQPS